jgi:dTDP-4-dehydrorhamnose reductase
VKVLLFGKNGQVGSELVASLPDIGTELIALDRDQADLTKPNQVLSAIRTAKPDVVINAAAYTAVDKAESQPEVAHTINATAVEVMAAECKAQKAFLFHYSTDYVFDGRKRQPYVETDATNPLGVYGASKLAGEHAIQAAGCRYLILRAAWVYSPRGKNFLLTILRLANEKKSLRIVNDQIGVPTSAQAIAELTWGLLHADTPEGIFHYAPEQPTSWHGFAKEIVKQAALHCEVQAISTAEYPTAARRPMYSVLSAAKLNAAFPSTDAWHWRDWKAQLAITLDRLQAAREKPPLR